MYASLSNNVINDNDMTGCTFRALAASCAAAFVLSAKGQQILMFVTAMSISGSCAFLMDYNFFLSEPRWGLCKSRLRPIDNPITGAVWTHAGNHSFKEFPVKIQRGRYFSGEKIKLPWDRLILDIGMSETISAVIDKNSKSPQINAKFKHLPWHDNWAFSVCWWRSCDTVQSSGAVE